MSDQKRLCLNLLKEYPTAGSLTLAKRLHKDFPLEFPTIENARSLIRYYRGEHGKYQRKRLSDLTHVKDLEKVLRDKFALPESAVTNNEPYQIPKVNKNILVGGDFHFPYQSNDAIYKFIEFGIKKEVDCIILNGDCIDSYHLSRFTKDSRKPSIEDECDMFYQFLLDLREVFPRALIIWKFGNHEDRWDIYLKTAAPLLSMVATERLEDYIPVNELNVIVVRDKRRIVAGDLNILHGHEYGVGRGAVNAARTMFLRAKSNTLVNHFHNSSSHKGRTLDGEIIRTWSMGSMCSQQDYNPYGDQDNSFGYIQIKNGVSYVTNWEV